MARSLKSNVPIKLGLINVPVNVQSALQAEVKLSTVCTSGHDPVAVKAPRVCPECGNTEYASFERAAKVAGELVLVDESTLESANASDEVRGSMVCTVHPAEQVGETLPGGKVYFLATSASSAAEYALLRDTVAAHPELAFLTRFAVRSREALYQLRVHDGALVISQLAWPETVNAAPSVDAEPVPGTREMLDQMLGAMVTDFDVEEYRDRHDDVLAAAIEDGATQGAPRGLELVEALRGQLSQLAEVA